jgi:hypothetical protein
LQHVILHKRQDRSNLRWLLYEFCLCNVQGVIKSAMYREFKECDIQGVSKSAMYMQGDTKIAMYRVV